MNPVLALKSIDFFFFFSSKSDQKSTPDLDQNSILISAVVLREEKLDLDVTLWWYLQCCHVAIWPVWLKYTKNKMCCQVSASLKDQTHRGGEADDAFGFLICYEIQKECLCARILRGTLWLMPTSPICSQTAYLTLRLSHRALCKYLKPESPDLQPGCCCDYFKQLGPVEGILNLVWNFSE